VHDRLPGLADERCPSPNRGLGSGRFCNRHRGRPPDERLQARTVRARPLLQSLHEWFEVSLTKLSRKSDTTAAIRYALGLWQALTRYCDDGCLEIDNNPAERALRVVALGRENY
jgi:transposase